jgi:hypothetical protein
VTLVAAETVNVELRVPTTSPSASPICSLYSLAFEKLDNRKLTEIAA